MRLEGVPRASLFKRTYRLLNVKAHCGANQLHKSSQLFIGTHHETLSVTMRVNDPDRFKT